MNHYTFAIKDAKDDAQSSLASFCRLSFRAYQPPVHIGS